MSEHDKALLKKRREFAQLILDGKSIAQAARIVKLSPDYARQIKKGLENPERTGGRSSKTTEDADRAQIAVDKYFASCEPEYWKDEKGGTMLDSKKHPIIKSWQHPTVAGLAMAVGYATRESFMQATMGDTEYSRVLMRARFKIEQAHEDNLYNPGSAGSIFALKNIAGWTDKQEVKQDIVANVSTKLEKLDDALTNRIRAVSKQVLMETPSEDEDDER